MTKIAQHCFNFCPEKNGGETVLLTTTFHKEDDGSSWSDQELMLISYDFHATIKAGVFTPDKLRELANELDKFYAQNSR